MMLPFIKPDVRQLEKNGNVKGLIKALKYKNDPYVRWTAAKILGKWKEKKAVKPLIELLNDPDWHVRGNAAEALGNIRSKEAAKYIERLLDDESSYVRSASATALGKIKDPNCVESLINHLSDRDFEVRIRVIEALGEIGDIRALEPLINLLKKGRDNRVEVFIGEALGKIGKNPVARENLITILKFTEYPNIKWAIARAFYDIKDRKVIPYLINLLNDPDPSVRAQAIATLGEIGEPGTIDLIIKALKDFAWEVRKQAAEALIKLKAKNAVDALKQALEKEISEDVEASIRKAISYLSGLNIEQQEKKQ